MKIDRVVRLANGLDLFTASGMLRIQAMNELVFHIRYTNQAEMPQEESLLVIQPAPETSGAEIIEDEEYVIFRSDALTLEVNRQSSAFTWKDREGGLLVREPERGGKFLTPIQFENHHALSTRLDLVFSDEEVIYGLGQHEEGIYNYRGHNQVLYQHNLKVAMPVIVSSRGYALFFDSCSLSNFHDDPYGSYFWCEAEQALDFYFIYGPEFDDLVGAIRWLTGQASMLPKWAYGYIQSKERYRRQSELVEIAQEYRRRGIGLDCIVLDWQSWSGKLWGQKSLDPDRFPDPKKMMEDLHSLNTRLMVSIWPNFNHDGPDQVEMRREGFLLGNGRTYDAFNPAARTLYWQQANRGLFQHGIDAWWCDASEPFDNDWHGAVKPEPWQRMINNTARFKQNLNPTRINAYSLLHSRGIYEGQRSVTEEKRVVNLTRSAYPGQVRYGTVTWSGDISASWDTLRKQIPAALNFTVCGSPRWTFDIGGFFSDRHPEQWFWDGNYPDGCEDRAYRELYLRWFQVAAFLPMFRAHGTDTPREVWRFGKPGEVVYDTLVNFIRLRYRLLPYLYSLAAWETFRGYTMLRSLSFDFRHDPLVHNISDQFMLGPALMVCPVLEPMVFTTEGKEKERAVLERTVYLPSGSSWYNFWNGKRYAGGQILRTAAPLEIIPLFVRAGSVLPLGPDIQFAGEKPAAPLEIRVYPGQDGRFDLYDDEGDSYRYEQGGCIWLPLTWKDSAGSFSAGPRSGSYRGMPPRIILHLVIAGSGIDHGKTIQELSIWDERAIQIEI